MSNTTPLLGFIQEYIPTHQTSGHDYRSANDIVLEKLPLDDDFPPLCRCMVSTTGNDTAHGSFRGQRLIYLGGYFNHILHDLPRWLDKFECLLKSLYWTRAEVHINGGWMIASYVLAYQISQPTISQYAGDPENAERVWDLDVFNLNLDTSNDERLGDFLGGERGELITRLKAAVTNAGGAAE